MLKLEKLLAGTAFAVVLAISSAHIGHAGFDEAVKAYEAGDYESAYNEWLPLARSNDPAAMRNIGHLYRRGRGVDQDYEKAMSWYLRAAEMGFDRAQANVAIMYLKGEGVPQNYNKASEWFSKAARVGHTIAQYNLGLMYEHGKGVEKSTSKALGWYNLAAKAGHKQALDKLSILVARNPNVKEEQPVSSVSDPVIVARVSPKEKEETAPKSLTQSQQTPSQKKTDIAKQQPKPIAKPKQTIKQVEKPAPADVPKVAVVSKPVVATPPAKAAEQPAKKKWEPFAGSANNGDQKGEPTVFSQSKKQAVDSVTEKPREEEKKGFFAALKSLIAGDDKETEASENTSIEAPDPAQKKSADLKIVKPVVPKTPVVAAVKPAVTPVAPKSVLPKPGLNVRGTVLSLGEQLEMADLAFTLEEYQQALNVWAPLAQKGNAEAQYNLGTLFLRGYGVPIDRVRAYFWWEKAKNNGSAKAATSLSKLEKSLTFLEKRQLKRTN